MQSILWRTTLALALLTMPAVSLAASSVSLADLSAIINATEQEYAGTALVGLGDINGDGYEDVAMTAPYAGENNEGAVYLLYGREARIDTLNFHDLPTLSGESSGDQLGQQIGALGDINADGYDDFAVVSNYHDSNVSNPGTIYIIYGQATKLSDQTVRNRPRFYGEERSDGAGAAVESAGDLNSDGYDDFAIGAVWRDGRAGGVYLIYGQADDFADEEDLGDYALFTGDEYDYAGSELAAGDLNQDGVSDLVVSSRRHDDGNDYDVGAVYIIPGRVTHYADQPLDNFSIILGTTEDERIGNSLAIGDLNGDSYNDLVIGAASSDEAGTDAGMVYIMPGAATLPSDQLISSAIQLSTDQADDLFGSGVAILQDLNADGIDDLLTGAPSQLDPEAGRAFVTLGSTGLTDHDVNDDYPFLGEAIHNVAGSTVAGADINGDGVDEIVVGAPSYNSNAGKVYIGYWPIYTCSNSVSLGGILADYPTADYKLRNYAANSHFKIAVERHGRHAYVLNCITNEIVQTLTFNERVQRKILARVFDARNADLFVAVTRTPSKRRIKVFLYEQTATELVETDYFRRKWRPRGFRIKVNHKNKVVLQRGMEKKHRLKYQVNSDLTLTEL